MSDEGGDTGLNYPEIIATCSVEYEPKDRSHELADVRRAIAYFRPLLSSSR